jgi:hypothetical protein
MRRTAIVALGVGFAALGLLWLLQGSGVVHMRPLLCFADCQPVVGTSAPWLIAGAIMFLVGIAAVGLAVGLKRTSRR